MHKAATTPSTSAHKPLSERVLLSLRHALCPEPCPYDTLGTVLRVRLQVGLVPTACGGTNLYEQWAPGSLLWSNMLQDTAAALEKLDSKGRLDGILWVQVGVGDLLTHTSLGGNKPLHT